MDPQKTPPNDTDEDERQGGDDLNTSPQTDDAPKPEDTPTEDTSESVSAATDDAGESEPSEQDDGDTSPSIDAEDAPQEHDEADTEPASVDQAPSDMDPEAPAAESEPPVSEAHPETPDVDEETQVPDDTGFAGSGGSEQTQAQSDETNQEAPVSSDDPVDNDDVAAPADDEAVAEVAASETVSDESTTAENDDRAPAASQPTVAVTSAGSKKKKGMIALLIVVLSLFILGGGAVWGYFAHYLPNRPENVLKAALANSFSLEHTNSVSFEGDFNAQAAAGNSVSGSFSGAVGEDGRFDLSAEFDAIVTTIGLDVRSIDGSNIYVRASGLSGLPALLEATNDPMYEMYASLIADLDNQWIDINRGLIEEITEDSPTITQEQLVSVAAVYDEHPFLVVQEVLPDEQINGVDSYHYKVGIDKERLEAFTRALSDTGIELFVMDEDELQRALDAIKEANFKDDTIDVWISKGAKRFTQIAFTTDTEDGDKLTLRLGFTGYNESIEVEQPQNTKTLLEALGGMFGSELEGAVQGDMDILPMLRGGSFDATQL